jgi:3-deoxy-7-phosphoheptulonate synthase
MVIVMEKGHTEAQRQAVIGILTEFNLKGHVSEGDTETLIGAVGDTKAAREYPFDSLPGVCSVLKISKPYKLANRKFHPDDTVIKVGDVHIGNGFLTIIAGPCAVESREQMLTIARAVKKAGAHMLRGGAFKPRTSPYSFQGLGEDGLRILADAREETGLPIVTEMTSPMQVDLMVKYVDVIQIGMRNMQNFELLKSAGRIGKPVLLKRHQSATIEEWLMSAEYIMSEGNDQVILCERGILTFDKEHNRNTLDISAVLAVKKVTHLPIIVDPSHACGRREDVPALSRAIVAVGAHGLEIEVHHDPDKALSDGPQSLYPEQFERLMRELNIISMAVEGGGRMLPQLMAEKAGEEIGIFQD